MYTPSVQDGKCLRLTLNTGSNPSPWSHTKIVKKSIDPKCVKDINSTFSEYVIMHSAFLLSSSFFFKTSFIMPDWWKILTKSWVNNCLRYDPGLTLSICCLFHNLPWYSKGWHLPSSAWTSFLPDKMQSVSRKKCYFKFSKCCLSKGHH